MCDFFKVQKGTKNAILRVMGKVGHVRVMITLRLPSSLVDYPRNFLQHTIHKRHPR